MRVVGGLDLRLPRQDVLRRRAVVAAQVLPGQRLHLLPNVEDRRRELRLRCPARGKGPARAPGGRGPGRRTKGKPCTQESTPQTHASRSNHGAHCTSARAGTEQRDGRLRGSGAAAPRRPPGRPRTRADCSAPRGAGRLAAASPARPHAPVSFGALELQQRSEPSAGRAALAAQRSAASRPRPAREGREPGAPGPVGGEGGSTGFRKLLLPFFRFLEL